VRGTAHLATPSSAPSSACAATSHCCILFSSPYLQVHGVRGGLGRRGEGEGAARGLLAVVKRMPELLHMTRLQDRERIRQCARVVRPRALRRRRRRSRVLQRELASSARRSAPPRGHDGRRRRSLEGGAIASSVLPAFGGASASACCLCVVLCTDYLVHGSKS
jgi:hypothetical protein